MPRCRYCNQLNKIADCFQDPNYPSNQFCNEEHWRLYKESKKKKQVVVTEVKPKKPTSDIRKLTNYIQEIWPVEPNWQWFNKQIKNLCNETGLSHNDIRMTLKYCVEYLNLRPNPDYGLQQFIPKYCQEASDFAEDIKRCKAIAENLPEEEYNLVKNKPKHRYIKEDLEFEKG